MSGPWNIDKVHKVFGQPSRIDRGAYKQYDTLDDVLVFNFPGCYFYVHVDREGRVFSTHEFHFRPSELLGKDAAAPATQRADVDALYRAASTGDKAAQQRLRTLAEEGDAVAQSDLGWMYFMGKGVPKDAVQAVQWYRKAADQGYAQAQYSLGYRYANGEGVPKDAEQAAAWWRKAADQGYAAAQNNLGVKYASGEGVPKDVVQAVQWYRKAADLGYAGAQYNLGRMYASGEGVPKDAAQAAQWYRKAADQRLAAAQYALGWMYANGEGVPKDWAQAVPWLRKAADQGHAEAQRALAAVNATGFVKMVQEGGVYKVPVLINGAIPLNFIVDSGATDVSIPNDVVLTLIRTGTITESDFIGAQTYTLADGSTTSSPTFRIRSLKVGDTVLQDVVGSVANQKGDLLLGQSFLGRFKSWSINNTTHTLVLE